MTGNLEAVVLAAGLSSRAGTFKPALDCDGQSLIVRAVRAFSQTCSRIWVVVGYRGSDVARLVRGESLVHVVENPLWPQGMFTSVQSGLSRCSSDRVFVTPGDLPRIDPGVVAALAARNGEVVVPTWEGHGGHPILLSRPWVDRVLQAPSTTNLRDVLALAPRECVAVGHDGVVRDIDTCADYEDYQRRMLWAVR